MTTGLAGLTLPRAGEPYLISMWVDPSERGHAVGEQLTLPVLELARTSGAASVGLWVTEGNDAATGEQRMTVWLVGQKPSGGSGR